MAVNEKAINLKDEIKEAICDRESLKILASISKEGIVHAVPKGSIEVDTDGNIRYLELLESSVTNRNLIYSLWFEKAVSITVVTKEKKSWQIKGFPVKTLVFGREFEEAYVRVQERDENMDLAAVYIIVPTEVKEQTYDVRRVEEETKHPLYIHIDRLAK